MNKPCVLIVDDTPGNIHVLRDILKDDYSIKAATDGVKALAIATESPGPDLILLDIMMPEMDGMEVCRRLQADPRTQSIPVIFVTAKGTPEDEAAGLDAGALDYIVKPFSPPIVEARVRNHMALIQAQQATEDLLSRTLLGSVRALSDVLAMINKDIFADSNRMRGIVSRFCSELNLLNSWRFELAALLSRLGFALVEPEIRRTMNDDPSSVPNKGQVIEDARRISSDLLRHIPRLEEVADMIQHQNEHLDDKELARDISFLDDITLGGQLVRIASDLVRLSGSQASTSNLLAQLAKNGHHPHLLQIALQFSQHAEASDTWRRPEPKSERIAIGSLKAGMVLAENLESQWGGLLAAANTELSEGQLKVVTRLLDKGKIHGRVGVYTTE